MELLCSHFEVIGPAEEVDSAPVLIDLGMKVRGPGAAVEGVQQWEASSLLLPAVAVNISAVEVLCPVFELENSVSHLRPWLETDSVNEFKCSVTSVINVDLGWLCDLQSEVRVCAGESPGPGGKICPSAMDPVSDATESVLKDFTLTTLWLSAT